MRISLNASSLLGTNDVGALKDHAAQSAEEGFAGWWLAQTGLIDALTVFTSIGGSLPSLELGTAVIPTYPRHPSMLAGQALTTQAVMGDQSLVLGIGLSHQPVVEGMPTNYGGELIPPHLRGLIFVIPSVGDEEE